MLLHLGLFASGIILFMFGLVRLGHQVQRLFTPRMRRFITVSIGRPLFGLASGAVATVLFQSSSMITALTIGMVSAGLITLYNSLGIILGADIGTTFTVQLVVWKITSLSPVFIFAGGLMWLISHGRARRAGEGILSFGFILFGLDLMAQAALPLKASSGVTSFFQATRNPFLGLIVGIVFTALVHSSAIPISMLVILAQQGLVHLDGALYIVIGANIGTTITAVLAAAVATVDGKRSAAAHLLFKCAGAALCMILLSPFENLLGRLSSDPAQQIALAHLFFNLIIGILFLPLLGPVASVLQRVIPGKSEPLPLWPEYLDETCLERPGDALLCVKKELERQVGLAQKTFSQSVQLIGSYNRGLARDLNYVEMIIDNLRTEIGHFLWRISNRDFSTYLSEDLFAYTAMVDDIERIADHAVVISHLAKEKDLRRLEFSERGWQEMNEIVSLVGENLADAASLIGWQDRARARLIYEREEWIDRKVKEARERHLERFHRRVCQAEAGPVFLELLINLERISDHCENIAEYVEGLAGAEETA